MEPQRIEQGADRLSSGLPAVGKHLRYEPIVMENIAVGATGTWEMTWPYEIDLLTGTIMSVIDGSGNLANTSMDRFWAYAEMVVGQVSANAAIGATHVDLALGITADWGDTLVIGNNIFEVVEDQGSELIKCYTPLAEAITAGDLVTLCRSIPGRTGWEDTLSKQGGALYMGHDTINLDFGFDTLDGTAITQTTNPPVKLVIKWKNEDAYGVGATKTVIGRIGYYY